ncbi:MAG: nicotinate-nucleotide adenylyltransferase [Flavobacteriaceae bacterium]|nr:nicotinate-nucleotide adenylyltransferase [Flavobacteriaceae bacterium]
MKKLILGLLVIGLTSQVFSQVVHLPEIEITAVNYKYINAVDSQDLDFDVKMLEEKVALFDLKSSDFYVDEYSTYQVRFYIPNGTILAAYDGNGKVTRTIERFKDIKLPVDVRNAVFARFPGWTLKKDVYRVTYNQEKSRKEYKIVIEKNGKILRIKTDEKGFFLREVNLK